MLFRSRMQPEIIIDEESDDYSEVPIEFKELGDEWSAPVSLSIDQKIKEDMERIDRDNASKAQAKVTPKITIRPNIKPKIVTTPRN